jgi:hypothetical protein
VSTATTPQIYFDPTYAAVPAVMKEVNQWLAFRLSWNPETEHFDKTPLNSRGVVTNDHQGGESFQVMLDYIKQNPDTVLGFYIRPPFIAIDLDGCVDLESGDIDGWAGNIIQDAGMKSYQELSPSGTGIHIIGLGTKPGIKSKIGSVEIYTDKRALTVSAYPIPTSGELCAIDVTNTYNKMVNREYVFGETAHERVQNERASSGYGNKIHHAGKAITNLLTLLSTGDYTPDAKPFRVTDEFENWVEYPSQSEAVAALLAVLAVKHDCDAYEMEQAYLDSQLSNTPKWANWKWAERGDKEIKGAIALVRKSKSPEKDSSPKASTLANAAISKTELVQPVEDDLEETVWPDPRFAMTQEELDAQKGSDHPIRKLREAAGPDFEDALMYGPLGEVTRKLCEFSEANTGAVYLNLLVSFGNMIGRKAYFNAGSTKHYMNEFLAVVGDSSTGRKGTAENAAKSFLSLINQQWLNTCNISGFATRQAVIAQIKDSSTFKKMDKETKQYVDVEQPGVDDKRLCIREGELSNVFKLMSDPKTKAAELIRDLWDGVAVSNIVAGKSVDGENNSLKCAEPHVSIIGSSTQSLVKSTMPVGVALSGDGNRFLWCYAKRTQLSSTGGPMVDWTKLYTSHVNSKGKKQEVSTFVYFTDILKEFGMLDADGDEDPVFYPLTPAARKHWDDVYWDQETSETKGFLGGMTSRSSPHIRRMATILCIIDRESSVDVKHLKAAEGIWDYTQRCAQHIFIGYSIEQYQILKLAKERGAAGIRMIDIHDLFKRHETAEWIRAQIKDLVSGGFMTASGKVGDRGVIYVFKKE